MGRHFNSRPSAILGIAPASAFAFDLDAACVVKFLEYENERDFERLKSLGRVMKIAVRGAVAESFGSEVRDEFGELERHASEDEADDLDDDDIL